MPPSSRHREIVASHVVPAEGRGDSDGGEFWAQRTFSNAGHGRIGVEQPGEFTAPRRRPGERLSRAFGFAIGPAGKRDARTLRPQGVRIDLVVGGGVEHGQGVVEQSLHACRWHGRQSETFEIALRRIRQVGEALRSTAANPEATGLAGRQVVAEPYRNTVHTAVHLVEVANV